MVLGTKYPQVGKAINKSRYRQRSSFRWIAYGCGSYCKQRRYCAAIANILKTGLPLIERITTVTGSGIKEPKNLLIRIGTPLADLIEQCGGFKGIPGKVLMGGPMMGLAQSQLDVPAIKGTSGLLVLEKSDVDLYEPLPCIKCARCVDACPINLLPTSLVKFSEKGMWYEAESYHAMDCIECGCCSFVCPARIPLTQHIRIAKSNIIASRKRK